MYVFHYSCSGVMLGKHIENMLCYMRYVMLTDLPLFVIYHCKLVRGKVWMFPTVYCL